MKIKSLICKNTTNILGIRSIILILLTMLPPLSYADAGIPMLIVAYPFMVFALIPVILIESYSMKKILGEISVGRSIKACTVSNLVSTILGIPCTWIILLFIDFSVTDGKTYFTGTAFDNVINFTLGAPWVPEGWYVFAAMMFLLIPFFFASWYIENKVSQIMLKSSYENAKIKKATFLGNLYSYLFLEVVIIILWVLGNK